MPTFQQGNEGFSVLDQNTPSRNPASTSFWWFDAMKALTLRFDADISGLRQETTDWRGWYPTKMGTSFSPLHIPTRSIKSKTPTSYLFPENLIQFQLYYDQLGHLFAYIVVDLTRGHAMCPAINRQSRPLSSLAAATSGAAQSVRDIHASNRCCPR